MKISTCSTEIWSCSPKQIMFDTFVFAFVRVCVCLVNVMSALDQLSKTQINLKGKAKYTSEIDGEPPFFLILSCTSRRSCRLAFSNCVLIALLASRALTCRRLFSVACWMPMCTCNACLLWKHLCPYHCAPQKWQGWVPAVAQRTNLKFPHPSEHTWCFAPSFARALWHLQILHRISRCPETLDLGT